jgi:hypothetical protein
LLGALALPYAFVGGVLAGGSFAGSARSPLTALPNMPAQIAAGSVAIIAVAVAAAIGVGQVRPVFVAGIMAGLAGIVDAAVGLSTTPVRAAAVTLGLLVLFAGFAPTVAARVGGLPRPGAAPQVAGAPAPVASSPTATQSGPGQDTADRRGEPGRGEPGRGEPGRGARGRPGPVDTGLLFAAVSRTDDVLTGLLVGIAIATGATAAVIAVDGGWPGRLLLFAAAGAIALRARMYAAVRHRVAALITAGLAGAPLLAAGSFAGAAALLIAAAFGVIGLVTIGLGAGERAGLSSPYLGRLADLGEVISLAAIVPLMCVVLGLYGRLRGLHL